MLAERRILVVAMSASVHALRWIRMVARPNAAILLFPVYKEPVVPEDFGIIRLDKVTADLAPGLWLVEPDDVWQRGDTVRNLMHGYVPWAHSFLTGVRMASPNRLQACIERFQPDLLHSMEVQLAGYLCLETARRMRRRFPTWVLSNWGSDIDLFRKIPEHQSRLAQICARIDYYLAECARDRKVAHSLGYRGPDLPIIPASGGAPAEELAGLATEAPSRRRIITVKGYHGWSGRGLLALSAVVLAREHLEGFAIRVPLASAQTQRWVRKLRRRYGLDIENLPYEPDHAAALRRLAQSRAIVGLGISDGISTTLLESMAVGVFPIQSSTACADEWIECGRSGYVVSPDDTRAVADALIAAVEDDALVDRAAIINRQTIQERWDMKTNARIVWDIYERAAARA
jgi:glycosyltransferase involved in cell wall biosynthesis